MPEEQGKPNPNIFHIHCTASIMSSGVRGEVQFSVFCSDGVQCLARHYELDRTDLLQQLANSARKILNIEPNMSGHVFAQNSPTRITAQIGGYVCDQDCPNMPQSDEQTTMRFPLEADSGTEGNK